MSKEKTIFYAKCGDADYRVRLGMGMRSLIEFEKNSFNFKHWQWLVHRSFDDACSFKTEKEAKEEILRRLRAIEEIDRYCGYCMGNFGDVSSAY